MAKMLIGTSTIFLIFILILFYFYLCVFLLSYVFVFMSPPMQEFPVGINKVYLI